MNYSQLGKEIIKNVGGESNVNSLGHCATRLRFKIKDRSKVNKENIQKLDGVISVVESGGQFQIIIGNTVGDVYDAIGRISKLTNDDDGGKQEPKTKEKLFDRAIDLVSSIFTPILPALIGSGMIKGLLMLAKSLGLNPNSGAYMIFNAASDSVFYFLPILLAYTSAKKFKANLFIAAVIAGALIHPTLVAAFTAKTSIDFFGIPVVLMKYTSSVLPIIFAVYFLSKLEYICNKYINPVAKNVLTPLICIGIVVPCTYLVIGPITTILGNTLGDGYQFLYALSPIVAGFILGGLWQALVVFGLHWGIVPIGYNNLALYGRNTINGMVGPSNFAQAGAAFGVFLKSRDTKVRQLTLSASITALFSITEPAIYGVTLKYKKPFYIACFSGAIAGAIAGAAHSAALAAGPVGILSIPIFMGQGFGGFIVAILVAFFMSAILTYLFGYNDKMNESVSEAKVINSDNNILNNLMDVVINAPSNGEIIALSDVKDEAFASESMGKGIAIIPSEGKIYSPVDGVILALFPTGHAIGLKSNDGAEILIHIGFDTVELKGKYFKQHVVQGAIVKKGDLLVEFDIVEIKKAGYDITTPMVITNTADFTNIVVSAEKQITINDMALLLTREL